MKVNFFILDRLPKTFHEDVIIDPATTIHADPDPRRLKMLDEFYARKLNPLVQKEKHPPLRIRMDYSDSQISSSDSFYADSDCPMDP
jgi:hypothetical protein